LIVTHHPAVIQGETTLTILLAFTALRMEMTWRRRSIDSYDFSPRAERLPFTTPEVSDGSETVH